MARHPAPVFSAASPRSVFEDIESVSFIEPVRQAEKEIEALCEEYRQRV